MPTKCERSQALTLPPPPQAPPSHPLTDLASHRPTPYPHTHPTPPRTTRTQHNTTRPTHPIVTHTTPTTPKPTPHHPAHPPQPISCTVINSMLVAESFCRPFLTCRKGRRIRPVLLTDSVVHLVSRRGCSRYKVYHAVTTPNWRWRSCNFCA